MAASLDDTVIATASSSTAGSAISISDLRISTKVITAHWGVPLNRDALYQMLPTIMIPIWYPGEGIMKIEYKNMVLGTSHKDVFTNRKITNKSFFNQATMVIRRQTSDEPISWKEVNVKLFANGGIQMTGIISESFARETLVWLLQQLLSLQSSPFEGEPNIRRFSVQLINTDYTVNKYINQDALHKILINEYNLVSMLEKTIYQGVNTKFFYNTNNNGTGICMCPRFCKGQGSGDGDGQCKRITMSVFRTGTIIITGARQLDHINFAYTFLNRILIKHAATILYEPTA